MEAHVESDSDAGVATLVSGIVQDARRLLVEQLSLFQVEIKNDVRRMLTALIPLVAGVVIIVPSLLLLGMGAAHLLSWAIPDLPLWGGFVIIGGGIAAVGMSLVIWGAIQVTSINPMPETALNELKENIAVLGERKENINGKRTSNSNEHGTDSRITDREIGGAGK